MAKRHLINVVLLACVGYGAFAIGSLLFKAFSSHTVFIDWITGLLMGVAFAASEIFNTGRGTNAGIVRRIGISVVAMIVARILSIPIIDALGLVPHKNDQHDAYGPFAPWLVLFATVMTLIWLIWIPEKKVNRHEPAP
jgi:hypothetical protein